MVHSHSDARAGSYLGVWIHLSMEEILSLSGQANHSSKVSCQGARIAHVSARLGLPCCHNGLWLSKICKS